MQQPGGQTLNGGAPISNGGPGITGSPLATALTVAKATDIQWSKMLTVCDTVCVQAGYVLWLQLFCNIVVLSHSDLLISSMHSKDFNYRWPEIDRHVSWCMGYANQSRRHVGALVGLAPPNKAPTPQNWNMKHYGFELLTLPRVSLFFWLKMD